MKDELPRRLFHTCSCLVFPIAALLLPRDIFLALLTSVTLIFLLFELVRLRFSSVNNWFVNNFHILLREKETTRLTSSSYLLIACVIAFLVFDKFIAVLSFAFLAVGDPVGGAAGQRWGKRKIRGKSIEGSLAFLLAALIFGLILNMVTQVTLPVLFIGVLGATLIEFLSLPPNDNLTVPIFSGGVMTLVKFIEQYLSGGL